MRKQRKENLPFPNQQIILQNFINLESHSLLYYRFCIVKTFFFLLGFISNSTYIQCQYKCARDEFWDLYFWVAITQFWLLSMVILNSLRGHLWLSLSCLKREQFPSVYLYLQLSGVSMVKREPTYFWKFSLLNTQVSSS